MSDTERPFPLWGEPATKGDIISTMVLVQAGLLKIQTAMLATHTGHAEIARAASLELGNIIKDLRTQCYTLGGGAEPNG